MVGWVEERNPTAEFAVNSIKTWWHEMGKTKYPHARELVQCKGYLLLIPKQQVTNGWFKPMVRVLKNLRGKLVEDEMIEADVAPSYYIEGLLYNVPNEKFGKSYGDSFVNCMNWILEADRSEFLCANEQYYLLREGSPITWRDSKCTEFLAAACDLWKQW